MESAFYGVLYTSFLIERQRVRKYRAKNFP